MPNCGGVDEIEVVLVVLGVAVGVELFVDDAGRPRPRPVLLPPEPHGFGRGSTFSRPRCVESVPESKQKKKNIKKDKRYWDRVIFMQKNSNRC